MMRFGIVTFLCLALPFLSKCHGLRGRRTRTKVAQSWVYGEQEEANSSEIPPSLERRNLKSSSSKSSKSKSSKSKSSKSKSSKSKSSKSTSSDEQEDVPQQEELPTSSSSSSSSSSSKSGKKKKKSSKLGKQKTRPTASTPVQAPAATPGATPAVTPTAPPATAACTVNADCASTVCVGGFCQDGKQAAGQICDIDGDTLENNGDCANDTCGRLTGRQSSFGVPADFVCCPSGKSFFDLFGRGNVGTFACSEQADGDPCYTNDQCTSAVCVDAVCLSGLQPEGAACDGGEDCIAGFTCRNSICDSV